MISNGFYNDEVPMNDYSDLNMLGVNTRMTSPYSFIYHIFGLVC